MDLFGLIWKRLTTMVFDNCIAGWTGLGGAVELPDKSSCTIFPRDLVMSFVLFWVNILEPLRVKRRGSSGVGAGMDSGLSGFEIHGFGKTGDE